MPTRYWPELKRTFNEWLDHDGPRLAASLSLYSLLSLAPLVVLSISGSIDEAAAPQAALLLATRRLTASRKGRSHSQ